ncbi:PPC domain-containing protein [Azospirillum sp.]|uniref:PPC domain-containing protein n=1 Tax=Azospirillum sp. TaxID=34012 RepID=UPI002D574FF7|nr:PPC domain-containing protein [Azospirillum sp.]HYD64540.1 PPC domain-containing protein [Azospirillum sp.]
MPGTTDNSRDTAQNVGTLGSTDLYFWDYVGSDDTEDYYSFTTTGESNFRLNLDGLSADADVKLFDSSGYTALGNSSAGGSTSEAINLSNLSAGSYYVWVYSYGGYNSTSYQLRMSATPTAVPDTVGDTTATARDFGALTAAGQLFNENVGGSDGNDYYRFTIAGPSTFSLSLTGLSADADVQLVNEYGSALTGSNGTGSAAEAINWSGLTAGAYYVRVYSTSSTNTPYSLQMSAVPTGPVDSAGNSTWAARDIGALTSAGGSFNDAVGSDDTNDYYRFTTSEVTNFQLSMTGLSADADVKLLDSSGFTSLGSSSASGSAPEAISLSSLPAGTYYVRVYPYGGTTTDYTLTLSATSTGPAPGTDAVGNTMATASNLGILATGGQSAFDSIGAADADDYYQFTTNTAGDLSLSLTGMTGNGDVELFDSFGASVSYSSSYGSASESLSVSDLAAGVYYVRVYSYDYASTPYSLSLSLAEPPPADTVGNTMTAASSLTWAGATAQSTSEHIGGTDTHDHYRLVLTEPVNLTASLTGLTQDANVRLLGATGLPVSAAVGGSNTGTADETLMAADLAAGTYYLDVAPAVSGGAVTSYTLSFTAPSALPPDNAGNTQAAARMIEAGETEQTFSDHIGRGSDSDDYYKFVTTDDTNLSVNLSGLGTNADIKLLGATGAAVTGTTGGTSTGTTAETLTRSALPAGTYYLRVLPGTGAASAGTNYTLGIATPLYIPPDQADNSLTQAQDIEALGPAIRRFSDHVGGADAHDHYRFTLSRAATVTLSLSGLRNEANIILYSATSGNPVTVSTGGTATGTADETQVYDTLAAGTYVAQVYPADTVAGTRYSLGMKAEPAVGADPIGNTKETAQTFGTLANTSDSFRDGDSLSGTDIDMYRFVVTSNSTIRLQVDEMTSTVDMALLNATSDEPLQTTSSRTQATLSRNVGAGTYYVKLSSRGGVETPYAVSVSAVPTDRVGNSAPMASWLADPLNLNGVAITSNEFVGDADTSDYYRFSIRSRATIRLNLSGMEGDANLKLYNALDRVVATSNQSGSAAESIERVLTPGTYYAQVIENASDTQYTLNLTGEADDADRATDGAITAATNMGILSSRVLTGTDWVGTVRGTTDIDVYKFSTIASGKAFFELTNMTGDADLELLDSTGRTLRRSSTSGSTPDTFNYGLGAGTYYVRVRPDGGAETSYTLNLRSAYADLAGNTFATPYDVGTLTAAATTVREKVGDDDATDYYRFTVDSPASLALNLTGMTGDADLAILRDNSAHTVIRRSNANGSTNESINVTLTEGSYFVQVSDSGSDTPYALGLRATYADGAEGTTGSAKSMGILSSRVVTAEDYMKTGDTDVFSFRVSAAGTASIALNEVKFGTSINVSLLAADGDVISNNRVNSPGTVLTPTLAVGQYFVKVTPSRGETAYDLVMSAASTTARMADRLASVSVPPLSGGATSSSFGVLASLI